MYHSTRTSSLVESDGQRKENKEKENWHDVDTRDYSKDLFLDKSKSFRILGVTYVLFLFYFEKLEDHYVFC